MENKNSKIGFFASLVKFFKKDPYKKIRRVWEDFYIRLFGIDIDLSDVTIPDRPGPDWILLILIPGVTTQTIYAKSAEYFKCVKYTKNSLDELGIRHDRDANEAGAYAVWTYANEIGDEVNRGKTADEIIKAGIKSQTLPERLILGLFVYDRKRIQIDMTRQTLCAGSHLSSGNVYRVGVDAFNSYVGIFPIESNQPDRNLRARVVSV